MDGIWETYWLEASISTGASLFTVVALRFKAWMRGLLDEEAPMLRQFVAYLLAYFAGFTAIHSLEGTARYLVMISAAALAFGVTLNGPAPLWTQGYARKVGIALCCILVLIVIVTLMDWLGVDLTGVPGA